jgi:DNA-directed RNA polymerase subunit RPC12/RpoP
MLSVFYSRAMDQEVQHEQPTCPYCGGKDWQPVGGNLALMAPAGGEHFTVRPLVCTACGHVRLLADRFEAHLW